jgi:hypothetical protein
MEAQSAIVKIEQKFLARLKAHFFADRLGNHDLEFR